jgi:choloylglycine hydrolase
MCLGFDTVAGWTPTATKCLNDQGLAITHANVPKSRTPYDPGKPHFRYNFLEKIAAECATVKQAVAMIRAYTLPENHGAHVHLMLADASGDAAVVEWVDGEVKVIRRDGPVLFMTNHLLSKPETAGPADNRYGRGSRILAGMKEPSVGGLIEVPISAGGLSTSITSVTTIIR